MLMEFWTVQDVNLQDSLGQPPCHDQVADQLAAAAAAQTLQCIIAASC